MIVTPHPNDPWFTPEIEDYFRSKFPNFIYSSKFQEVASVSQYLIEYVDAVMSVSSMVGLQSLIWKKKLIGIGDTQLKIAADYCLRPDVGDISVLPQVLAEPDRDKTSLLFWLLTRFYIPEDYLFNPKWLEQYLCHFLEKAEDVDFSTLDFDLIDDPKRIIHGLMDQARIEIPQKNGYKLSDQTIYNLNHLSPIGYSDYCVEGFKRSRVWQNQLVRSFAEDISLSEDKNRFLLINGWNLPEPGGVWSEGRISDILVSLPSNDHQDIKLSGMCNIFLTPNHQEQQINLYVNNEWIVKWEYTFGQPPPTFTAIIPARVIEKSPQITHLRFYIGSPKSPRDLGISSDDRQLGMNLISIRFEKQNQA